MFIHRLPLAPALLAIVVCAAGARAQISPGPLSRAHASLSGPTRCATCHDVAKRPPELKCLECHSDIRTRLQERRGLHPSLVGRDLSGSTCAQCHSEHNGEGFSLVHWDTPVHAFDHRRASFTLEGRHAKLTCRECHRADRIPSAVAATLSAKDLNRTYLGLSRECSACHADEHRGQFPGTCDRCHNESGWKGALRFNHSLAKFAIAGAHEKVQCVRCHPAVESDKPYTKYKGLAFDDCTPCHRDPHNGAFKFACSNCHSPLNWKAGRLSGVFSHASTRYPLEGKHAPLACHACHKESNFRQPVAFAECSDCHRKDPHQGQFGNRADGGDCRACHNVSGFKPTTFSVAQHQESRYPLEERHATVACVACHKRVGDRVNYRIPDTRCQGCHADVHQGQFRDSNSAGRCEDCHTLKQFKPSTFTLARHDRTRFRLGGAHLAVACGECHGNARTVADGEHTVKTPPGRFSFPDRSCTACHADPHRGEFKARMAAQRPDGTSAGCTSCHSTDYWKDTGGFDHSRTDFALEGSHRVVGCTDCHKSGTLKSSLAGVSFKSAPRMCSGCHEDAHGGQFAGDGGATACAGCHTPSKWKLTTFDHETGSRFSLKGAHAAVRCSGCHKARQLDPESMVVQFKGTPRECVACHGALLPRG